MKKIILSLIIFTALMNFALAENTRIACVGDSITYGHGIKNESEKYPQQLDAILGKNFDVRNFGVSGTTLLSKGNSPYINTKAYKNALKFKPNIVIIKLGTNDTKPLNWKFVTEFESNLNALIDSFGKLETKPIIYLCYPCPYYTLNGQNINEDRIFNGVIPIIRKVAKARKLGVIDMHTALSDAPECFPDKLHPNAKGAKIMAETVAKRLEKDNLAKVK